ncbi:MAG: hypothetical protein K6E79_06670 [Pseudobutyrivibrio sp.]|nr:hypothetical protein [Pseudobutyrivibrio sp.]
MNFTRLKNKIFILIFLGILVFPWVAGGALRVISPKTFEKVSTVETEKRDMAQIEWKNLMSTGESVSAFIDDRIPFRYTFISWYKDLNDFMDEKYQTAANSIGSYFYTANKENSTETADSEATNEPIVPAEEVPEEVVEETPDDYYALHTYQDVIVARDGWLFLYGENEIECYQGTNIPSQEELASYSSKVNELQELCNAQGKQLYIYIAPNKSQVYSQYMPTVDIVNTYKREQVIHSYINENCSTPYIYPLTESINATGMCQTYYKYDTHWNHMGALFGTNALYAAMGMEQTYPLQWATGTQDADKYELYTYMGIPDSMVTHDDTELTVDYRPDITVEGLDDPEAMICHTTSTSPNQQSLCLIGDSFRVNMAPYLAKDFATCTFCHRDYMSEIHDDIKNSNIIVIEAVERYDYEAFNTIQRTINVLK